jgi:hypothetical protein
MTRSPQNQVVPAGFEQQTKQKPNMQIFTHVMVWIVMRAA